MGEGHYSGGAHLLFNKCIMNGIKPHLEKVSTRAPTCLDLVSSPLFWCSGESL